MSSFAETSFLFSFYFPRLTSERAIEIVESRQGPIFISTLIRFEFQQAAWFEVWRRSNGHANGLTEVEAQSGLAAFEIDLAAGVWEVAQPGWEKVITRAERLTTDFTARRGARAMDILHVATALEIGATHFLTFDGTQQGVAEAAGLQTLG